MPEIPVGATVELRNNTDSWRVVSYYDDKMPRFVRQDSIMSLNTGMKRVFKNEIFKKNTNTYEEITCFFFGSKHFMFKQMFVRMHLVVVVVLLFYVHGKHLRSCRDGQLT